jgi:hypothetical protein
MISVHTVNRFPPNLRVDENVWYLFVPVIHFYNFKDIGADLMFYVLTDFLTINIATDGNRNLDPSM